MFLKLHSRVWQTHNFNTLRITLRNVEKLNNLIICKDYMKQGRIWSMATRRTYIYVLKRNNEDYHNHMVWYVLNTVCTQRALSCRSLIYEPETCFTNTSQNYIIGESLSLIIKDLLCIAGGLSANVRMEYMASLDRHCSQAVELRVFTGPETHFFLEPNTKASPELKEVNSLKVQTVLCFYSAFQCSQVVWLLYLLQNLL